MPRYSFLVAHRASSTSSSGSGTLAGFVPLSSASKPPGVSRQRLFPGLLFFVGGLASVRDFLRGEGRLPLLLFINWLRCRCRFVLRGGHPLPPPALLSDPNGCASLSV